MELLLLPLLLLFLLAVAIHATIDEQNLYDDQSLNQRALLMTVFIYKGNQQSQQPKTKNVDKQSTYIDVVRRLDFFA